MIELVKQQLDQMKAQERHLEEQLLLTRGAVQVLQHILSIHEAGQQPASVEKDRTDAKQ